MADFTSQYTGQQIEDRLSRVGTNTTNIHNLQLSKQDTISDLASIRSGAAAGSTALQPGDLSGKQDKLVSGVNIKTVDGQSLTGSGNIDLSRFVTSTVNNLANYYLKSEVYTKEEVQQLVYAATNGLSFVVAEALPTASNLTVNKIYLVPSTDPKAENVKDEWITIQVLGGYAWERIGSATVDLSQYYTKSEVDTMLANIDLSEYMPKSGGTMTGQLKWQNENALPKTTSLSYLLGIDSFSAGGTTKYITIADLAASLVTPLTSTNLTKEAYLQWGGRNFTGSYGPIDAAMVTNLGANRFAFLKAAGIEIEYSRDAGETWQSYERTDLQKTGLFSTNGYQVYLGASSTNGESSADYMLRVNVYTKAAGIYSVLNKFIIYLSTSGSTGCWCTIRARTQNNYLDDVDTWVTFADRTPVAGWSGYNVINTSGLTTFGNQPAYHYGHIQFIFGCAGYSGSYSGMLVYNIKAFGGVGWTTPSQMATDGHLYSYDASQAAYFPNLVRATKFVTLGGSSSKFVKGDGSLDSTAYQVALVSGMNIKTINNESLLGAGNLAISNGVDGKSAYQLWLDEGNTGTIQDFFDSLQGNSGYSGDISELEIVNNLYQGGATAALSAQQGVVLDGKITALKNSIVFLTEAEYENLANPDPTKIYMTYES